MTTRNLLLDFVQRQWLLVASGAGFALTSVYNGSFPAWSSRELQVLFVLFVLFVAVTGLQQSGIITRLSRLLERGRAIPLKLVMATFFLSMLLTNDVALIVIVPLTLALDVSRRDVLVILEALAANAGSALTPFGNPQNLFIYWFYDVPAGEFIASIAPFSLVFLVILVAVALAIEVEGKGRSSVTPVHVSASSWVYAGLLAVVLLTVVRVLPVWSGLVVVAYALLLDRKSLRVDYPLLASFFFFFGLAENLKVMLASEISHPGHVFLLSALASQLMSNVPAALLFAKFTQNWEALLWGANAGGFGSLFGSLANLIAFRLYITHDSTGSPALFTLKFLVMGYMALFISIALYFSLGSF